MTLLTPLWMQAGEGDPDIEYSGQLDRALLRGLMHQEGIVYPDVVFGALKVEQRQAGANLSVDVRAGMCAVAGDDVADQGMYMCLSTGIENRTVPAPPVSGSRTHRVVAQVMDRLHEGTWSDYEWDIVVVPDPDGSGPPAVPDSAISLATVTVAAGQASVLNANIADTRVSAATIGAKYPLVSADADRPPNPYESEPWWRTDLKLYEVWDGTTVRVIGPLPAATQIEETTTLAGFTNTSTPGAPGSPVCGTTFVAPSSGKAFVTLSGRIQGSNNGEQTILGWELRTGGSIGSGTIVLAGANDRALMTSRAVNSGGASYLAASHRYLASGMTAGATYNVRTLHRVTGGSGTIERRALLIEPAP